MWALCILAWCLFVACICTAFFLDQKIADEVEQHLPIEQRPSLTWLNGRRAAIEARRRHRLLFPRSRLRIISTAVWVAAELSLLVTFSLASRRD